MVYIFQYMIQIKSYYFKLAEIEGVILSQEICHRDLKLENTLLDGSSAPRLKICDFGYSKARTY